MGATSFESEFEVDGFACVMRTGPMGTINGYLAVEFDHPWFAVDYMKIDVSVHGGLTYSASRLPGRGKAEDGRWWVGFDTGHFGDVVPEVDKMLAELGVTVPSDGEQRDDRFVRSELVRLAAQASTARAHA